MKTMIWDDEGNYKDLENDEHYWADIDQKIQKRKYKQHMDKKEKQFIEGARLVQNILLKIGSKKNES